MTEDTLNPPMADADAQRRAELHAEGEKLGLKFDKRFSIKRMEDMIADKKGEASAPPVVTQAAEAGPSLSQLAAQLAALQRENEALKAQPQPTPARSGPPPGTLTSLQMGTSPAQDSDDLAAAWRKATELGLAGAIPKGASIEQVMKRITDHLAAKAQEQQILEEQARRREAMPQQKMVQVRILKKGDGKVGKGVHLPGIGNACYRWGEIVDLPLDIAIAQEENGHVERTVVTVAA